MCYVSSAVLFLYYVQDVCILIKCAFKAVVL